jgi:hypothetical protein
MSEVVTWNDLGEEPPVMMQAPLVSLLLVDGGLEGKTHFWIFFWMGKTHTILHYSTFDDIQSLTIWCSLLLQ